MTFVGVSEMQFHTFFYVRYPSTGPHVQSVELQELHTTVQNVPDYAGLWAMLELQVISPLSVLLMCMHTSAHHIWSNSGL